jgi:Helix-turn-helix domain
MFVKMLLRDRVRWGRIGAQAARRIGLSLGAYRQIEAGERLLDFATYDAICKLFGWPQAFIQSAGRRQH